MQKKSRRVFSIILVLLGLVLSLSLSIFAAERSVETEVIAQAQSTEQKCLDLQPEKNNSTKLDPKAVSALKRSVYDRTRDPLCFRETLDEAEKALNGYQSIRDESSVAWLQAQLNQLSLLIEVTQWLNKAKNRLANEQWIPQKIDVNTPLQEWKKKLQKQLDNLDMIQARLLIDTPNPLLIYAQINFAWNLNRLKQNFFSFYEPSWDEIGKTLLERAIQNAQKLNDKDKSAATIYALGYYGKWYQTRGNYDEARMQTEKALRLASSIQAKDIAYQWEWQLGQIHKAQGNLESAIAAYNAAYNTLQSLRPDVLASNEPDPLAFLTFREKVEERVYREFVDLLLYANNPSQENLALARKVIDSLQIAELETFLQEPCPVLSSELIDQVVDREDPTAAVIYPIILEERLEVILKLPGQKNLQNYKTSVNRDEVENTLRQLRYSLEQPFFSSKMGKPKAQDVYKWLIRAAETLIPPDKIKTLLFVPDGLLRNIPMAALHDGEKFLIEKYAVGVSPGLQLSVSNPNKRYNALIAGLSEDPKEPGFGPLEYAEEEVCKVQNFFKKSQTILDDKEVNRSGDNCQKSSNTNSKNLQNELKSPEYNLIHLATHGQFSFFNRQETFILTASGKLDLDKWKTFLKDRGFNPIELLVLSACETATGDDRDTLGIAGVAVQTGTRSTIASLWSIDDASTPELMQQFYQGLQKEKLTKAAALQQAQLELLKNPSAYKPSHWAPYVLVGDWR
jgi:CHAT domain-containing protein